MRKTISGLLLTLLMLNMLTLAFKIQPAKAEPGTVIVPDDYPTIQAAINAANPGDTVYVRAGTYGWVVVNKTLSLIGESRDSTIIDGRVLAPYLWVVVITANNVTIKNFTIRNSGYSYTGIGLGSHNYCEISNNNIVNNTYGITLKMSSNNRILGNNMANNLVGIWLYNSFNNSISGNNVTANNEYGIALEEYSSSNSIAGNNIINNKYGIVYAYSSENKIYHNNFMDNIYQAYGNSMNVWDEGYPSGGNYWSDYTGVDVNGDGIGDTPYVIDANNQDRYPLMRPWTPISPWPMFQHDAQRTGRSTYAGPQAAEVRWVSNVGTPAPWGSLVGSWQPIIGSDGTIYLGSSVYGVPESYRLYAFNPDGTLRWQTSSLEGYAGTPAIGSDGTIFVGTTAGVVYALNADGTEKWRFYCGEGGGVIDITFGQDDVLYFSSGYQLYALNPDGTEKWSYQHKGYVQNTFTPPAVGPDGTIYTVYPGWWTGTDSDHGALFALNPNGTLEWAFGIIGYYISAPSVDVDGTIYVSGDMVYAFYPNATEKWHAPLAPYIGIWDSWFTRSWVSVGPQGTIIAAGEGNGDSILKAFSSDGNTLWSFRPEDMQLTTGLVNDGFVLDADGTVFVTWLITGADIDFVSRLYSISKEGVVKWTLNVTGLHFSYPAIGADGRLYLVFAFHEGDRLQQAKLYSIGPLENPLDFSIMASPTSLSTQQGSSGSSTITITSINGFNQLVQLSVSGAPSGVTATLNPVEVTPPPDGSTTSTLTVSVDTTATPGGYALTVTGTNGTITHSVGISLTITQVGEWSFAIITDLHIGWGYSDYGNPGYNDPDLEAAQNYWLTERLESVVERIIQTKNNGNNIKFVVVLGDIADTAEKSEFLKARQILNRLNDPSGDGVITDGVPYIPVIGNHDIWPYTKTQGTDPDDRTHDLATYIDKTQYDPNSLGDRFFQKTFWEDPESQKNRDLVTRIFGSSWQNQTHSSAPYLQNYKFSFGDMNFVCLDFNPRDPDMAFPGSDQGSLAQPFNDTRDWFAAFLEENRNRQTIVFSHHPFLSVGGFTGVRRDVQGQAELSNMVNYIKSNISDYGVKVAEFAGHTHFNDISTFFTTFGNLVVETEAVQQESADIIRIVTVAGQQIVDYNTFEGVSDTDPGFSLFFALSPEKVSTNQELRFVARTIDYLGGRLSTQTKIAEENIASYTYAWDFGDGTSATGSGSIIPFWGGDEPRHSYTSAGWYNVNLAVETPKGTIRLNEYPIFVGGELSPTHYIAGLSENMLAVAIGRDMIVTQTEGGQNTFQTVLISKVASPETPIVESGVHFESATEDIDLSTFAADVNVAERKSFFYMISWPGVIEQAKTLYIPSTGAEAVYVCFNAKSLDEVSMENADVVIRVGETINGITVTTTFYNGTEYYIVSGVTGTGGGELPTYALTITTTVGGTTDPAPGAYTYTANSLVQVTATPNADYIFDQWELDTLDIGSASPYTVLMDKNHTLKAVFTYSPPPPPVPEFPFGSAMPMALTLVLLYIWRKRKQKTPPWGQSS